MSSLPHSSRTIRVCCVVSLFCSAWNLLGDLYYLDFFKAYMVDDAFGVVRETLSQGHLFDFSSRNVWLSILVEAGGWMYPVWAAVTVIPLFSALQPSGQLHSLAPCLLLAYGLCVVGGALHSAFSFLTVLPETYHHEATYYDSSSANSILQFVNDAQNGIIQRIFVGALPGILACNLAGFWLAYVVHFKDTKYPRAFNLFNPVATMIWISILAWILPEGIGYYIGGSMGTWGIMMLNIGSSWYLWNDRGPEDLHARVFPLERKEQYETLS